MSSVIKYKRIFESPSTQAGGPPSSPIGPAGGDLTGTYPNPTIAYSGYKYKEEFIPTNGQTVFILANSMSALTFPILTINGGEQSEVTDYTVVGNILTWLNIDFVLQTTDTLIIHY